MFSRSWPGRFPGASTGTHADNLQMLQKAQGYAHHGLELMATLEKPKEMSDAEFTKTKNEKISMCHDGLGVVAVKTGKYDEAITELTQAIQLSDMPDPVDNYLLGVADENTSHFTDAIANFTKCAAKWPDAGAVQGRHGRRRRRSRKIAWRRPSSWEQACSQHSAMSERWLEQVDQALGYTFGDAALAERALSHRSAVADSKAVADNEQLEYLGDAVLGMIVSEYLVRTFPHWSEGQLSKSRARLVNAASLCAAARRLGLGEHMLLGRGEEKTGGREKPALLADAFEAVLAAIYLDGGLEAARGFVHRALLQDGGRGRRPSPGDVRPQVGAAGVAAGARSSSGAIPRGARNGPGPSQDVLDRGRRRGSADRDRFGIE